MVWLVEEFVISFPPRVNSLLLAGINAAPHVRFWHKADMTTRSTNVRYWGESGHRAITMRSPFMGQLLYRNDVRLSSCRANDRARWRDHPPSPLARRSHRHLGPRRSFSRH